jgi:hypothetical protein
MQNALLLLVEEILGNRLQKKQKLQRKRASRARPLPKQAPRASV